MKNNPKLTFAIVTAISVLLIVGIIESDHYAKRKAIINNLMFLAEGAQKQRSERWKVASDAQKQQSERWRLVQAAMQEYRKNLSIFSFQNADAGSVWCDWLGAELDQLIDATWDAYLAGDESRLDSAKAKIDGVASFYAGLGCAD